MKNNERPKQFPTDKDHLEVYPEKKQVSAFPERRFIKTNRMLVIVAIINLACILAGSGIFAYMAQRVDVKIQDSRRAYLYQINTEEKTLKPAEFLNVKEPAKKFIVEQALRDYIEVRHMGVLNLDKMQEKTMTDESNRIGANEKDIVKDRIVMRLTHPNLIEAFEKENQDLMNYIFSNRVERDVHIYNLHLLRGNLWTAVIETFDFPENRTNCRCMDNSTACLQCKNKHRLAQQRRRVWIRTSFNGKGEKDKDKIPLNPFNIQIEGYYVGYMPTDAPSEVWDLPPELKKDLPSLSEQLF